jgi:hypothetical protein
VGWKSKLELLWCPCYADRISRTSAVRFLWQHTIEAAVNEPDPKKRLERVYAAKAAIFSRFQELAHNWEEAQHQKERQANNHACNTLWILKRDALGLSQARRSRAGVAVSKDVKADHDWPVPTPARVFVGSKMEMANKQALRAVCEPRDIEVFEMHRVIGLVALASAIALGDFLAGVMKGSRIGEIIRESFTIGSWVSM